MIRWMLFSTLATGLLYGLYALLLRRDRWLQLSRWYLMGAFVFSLVFPLVRLPEALVPSSPTGEPAVLLTLNGVEVADGAAPPVFQLADAVPAIYLFGLLLTLAVLLFQLVVQSVAVLRLRRKHTVYTAADGFLIPKGASLVLLPDDTAPYSFFNQIVVGTRDLSDDELRCILEHESLHVRSRHTLDLIAVRVLCCVSWFNPFAWLVASELRAVHEYQADDAVLAAHGREGYLGLLYREATGVGYGHITNNFQSINIKNRIAMMKTKKSRFGAWKMLAALPVVAVLLMVGCKPAGEKTVEQEEIPFESSNVDESASQDVNTEEVVSFAEVEPEFPGGIEALYKYLADNIKYPEKAKADMIEGRVLVNFVIEKDGSVTNAKVLRSVSDEIDAEALRVVSAMPQWKPGMLQDTPVRVQYNLPIVFKLK